MARWNEHLVLIPRSRYATNYLFSAGSNSGSVLIAWLGLGALLLALSLTLLCLPLITGASRIPTFTLTLVLALFVFTPKAAHIRIMA